ncbi:unnamed protein product [Adineta steineri]|uniref:Protein sleepless n=1 Tax=Adineta steineri TaxID=433720 RepID=A0A819JIE7_9BILA|nr:unnamed protein product [Adineta steineri]CAF3933963.1 unnamed protein product [Adineta steineri]
MQSIFILLLTLGCISIVSTYRCYSCDGDLEDDCNDPFNATGGITDHHKEEAFPGEACTKTKLESKGGSTVERDTNSRGPYYCIGGQNGCKKYNRDGVTATVCCCTSDLCNGVSIVQQKLLTVFLTISTLAVFAYRWY